MKLQTTQRGMMLLEALMAILIFSLGVLGVVGINALAVSSASDAQYRTEANRYATQMINQIWVSVERSATATVPGSVVTSSLAAFDHNADGAACSGTATASVNPIVNNWVAAVRSAGSGLPGSGENMQQIITKTGAGEMNEVTVTVCWQAPSDAAVRRHVMRSFVN